MNVFCEMKCPTSLLCDESIRIPGASVLLCTLDPGISVPQSSGPQYSALFWVLRGARQKFLGVDECPVQKKKFFPRGLCHAFYTPVTPINFFVFASDVQNEVVGVTIL